MAKNTPAFQYYPSDFLVAVMHLSDEATGVYWKLLSALWINGNLLPFCLTKLARFAMTTPEVMHRVWPEIEDKFTVEGGNVMHDRFTKTMELSEKRRECGSKGGRPKLQKQNKSKSEANSRRMKTEERSTKNEIKEMDDWVFPDGWDRPDVREALDGWASMRESHPKIKAIESRKSTSKIFKRFDSPEHLIRAAEECEANCWQGLKPDYGRESTSNGSAKHQQTFGERKMSNTRAAVERARRIAQESME